MNPSEFTENVRLLRDLVALRTERQIELDLMKEPPRFTAGSFTEMEEAARTWSKYRSDSKALEGVIAELNLKIGQKAECIRKSILFKDAWVHEGDLAIAQHEYWYMGKQEFSLVILPWADILTEDGVMTVGRLARMRNLSNGVMEFPDGKV